MTDHIIKAAREAGFANQFPTGAMLEMFERFYAIAYRAGLEDAAKVCDKEHQRARFNMDVDVPKNHPFWNGGAIFADQLAEEIRALMKETP